MNSLNQKGNSFLELCVTLSILSLFLLLVTPSLLSSLERQEARSFLDQFVSDLNLASAQARSRETYVYVDILRHPPFYLLSIAGKPEKRVDFPDGFSVSSSSTLKDDRITFFGDGLVGRNGTLVVTGRDGTVYRVTIQMVSGRFEVAMGN